MIKRFIALFFLTFLLYVPANAKDPNPSYEVSVTTVTVWVKAVDKSGMPVQGLTQNDFVIKEDGHEVSPSCFEESATPATAQTPAVVQASASPQTASSQTAPAPSENRAGELKFVLFLDLYNTFPQQWESVKPSLHQLVDQLAAKNRQVMVAALTPDGRLGVIVPFTNQLAPLHRLLEEAPTNAKRSIDRRSKEDQLRRITGASYDSPRGGSGLADQMMDGYRNAQNFSEEEKRTSRQTLDALESFGSYLKDLNPGDHAVLIYVSGGFSNDPGRHYYAIVDELGERATTTQELAIMSQFRRPNFDFKKELQKSIGRLNRSNVTLYTIDASGVSEEKDYQEALQQVAEETGGIAFANSQNYQTGLNKIMVDLDHQYLICYKSPPHGKTGQFHTIKVETKRSGVSLRYRQGYVD